MTAFTHKHKYEHTVERCLTHNEIPLYLHWKKHTEGCRVKAKAAGYFLRFLLIFFSSIIKYSVNKYIDTRLSVVNNKRNVQIAVIHFLVNSITLKATFLLSKDIVNHQVSVLRSSNTGKQGCGFFFPCTGKWRQVFKYKYKHQVCSTIHTQQFWQCTVHSLVSNSLCFVNHGDKIILSLKRNKFQTENKSWFWLVFFSLL